MKKFKQILGNRVLLEQKKITKVGKILLASESQTKAQEANVVLVGPEVEALKPKDKVVYDKYSGEVLEDTDDHTIILVTEDDVFGIVEE